MVDKVFIVFEYACEDCGNESQVQAVFDTREAAEEFAGRHAHLFVLEFPVRTL